MNPSISSTYHFTNYIIDGSSDNTLKTCALDIGLPAISTAVDSLDDHDLQARWKDLTRAWETTQSNEERTLLFQKNIALLQKVRAVIASRMPSEPAESDDASSSLFQKNAQSLQGLLARLNSLLQNCQNQERPNSTKMILIRGLDGTVSYAINSLNGRAYTGFKEAWESLIREMQPAKSEAEQIAFISKACTVLAGLAAWVQRELNHVECLLKMVDTRKKHEVDFSLWQQNEVKTILARSLPEPTKRARNMFPHTFQAVDALILHVLNGDYGKDIREYLLTNGFFAQEHLLVLLLVDCIRDKRPTCTVEIFRKIEPEIHVQLQQTSITNDALFHWLSTNNAVLPEEHVPFMTAVSAARFDDEKRFAHLRESARLLYAPSTKSLFYLILNAKTEKMLQDFRPLIEKNAYTALQGACEIISYQDDQALSTDILEAVRGIEDEDAADEWLEMVLLGIAKDRGILAMELAHTLAAEGGYDLEKMLRGIVVIYAEEHPEEAKALLIHFEKEACQPILYSIAAFHARLNPQAALSIIDELTNRHRASEVLALIAGHQMERFGLEGVLKTVDIIPQKRKPAFYASLIVERGKECGLRSAFLEILPHLGEAQDKCIMSIAYQTAMRTESTVSRTQSFSFLVQELGESHQDLLRAGVLHATCFSVTAAPEVAEEEIDLLEQITDDILRGGILVSYIADAPIWQTLWEANELLPSTAEYQRRVSQLLPLVERVQNEELRDTLHGFLPCLVMPFDMGFALCVVAKIKDVAKRKNAIQAFVGGLLQQVTIATSAELQRTLHRKESGIPTFLHTLPIHLDALFGLVVSSAGDDTSFLKTVRPLFAHLWAPFSSKKALAFLDGITDFTKYAEALSDITFGHFTRYNAEPGDIDCILQRFPDSGPLFDPEYAALVMLFLRNNDVHRAMGAIGRIQRTEMKAPGLAGLIEHLCIQGALDEKMVALLESTFQGQELRDEVIAVLLPALDMQLFVGLKKHATIHGIKPKGDPTSEEHRELQLLAASLDPLRQLVDSWATKNVSKWHERLAFLYAPFSSTKALALFASAKIEDVDSSKYLLENIAYHSLSSYNSDGNKELDTILERLMSKPCEHTTTIANITRVLITHHKMIDKAVILLQRLLQSPNIPLQALSDCFYVLAIMGPQQCLDLLRETSDPALLADTLTTVIPELFHSGQLCETHFSPMCILATKCGPDGADGIYGLLASAYAKNNEDLARTLVARIRNEDTKQKWAIHVHHILGYKKLYLTIAGTDDEEKLAAFAITIAPYLLKEALDIAKRLSLPNLAAYVLKRILEVAKNDSTMRIFRHYADDIAIIKERDPANVSQ